MKTVQSQVLSSDPISLADATSFLSGFNNSVCGGGGGASVGASHETCWFVRRALASFEELEQLHRKLKDPRSDRKRRLDGSETRNDDVETTVVGQSFVASRDVSSKPKSHRQQESDDVNRKVEVEEQSKGGNRNLKEDGGEIAERVGVEIDDKKKKKKKKKREGDGESEMGKGEVKGEDGFRDFEEDESQNKKKKKKKRDNVDENGGGIKEEDGESEMGSEEVKRQEKKKKRKSEVLENGEIDALEEQQEKRKKRRKS